MLMPTSEFLYYSWCAMEWALQLVLKREARTGHPANVIVIYKLDGLKLSDWLNPLSAHAKMLWCRCQIYMVCCVVTCG